MDSLKSEFIFVVCQAGAEKALKNEFLKVHPEFRFAFSRPGFVTFKSGKGALSADFVLHSVFARAYGLSFGTFSRDELRERLGQWTEQIRSEDHPGCKIRLHAWERDLYSPGEEPLGYVRGELLGDLEIDLRRYATQKGLVWEADSRAEVGDWVFQVIAIDPEKYALGIYRHAISHSIWPGGQPAIELPAQAPSRAYLKLEGSLQFFKVPLKRGDTAVEIGSAPGGASFALLNRGLNVIGIDPAEMSPQVAKHPHFIHIKKPAARVMREELPKSVEWLLLDMNVEPNVSLYTVDRLASRMKDSLIGLVLTVKLNQWKIADEIPYMLEHVKAMGMTKVKAAQLYHHRQEIGIVGLTRRGMVRTR